MAAALMSVQCSRFLNMEIIMKLIKFVRKGALPASLMALYTSVQAAVPESVKTAIGEAKTDTTEMAGLILGVLVVFFGWRMIKKFI
jgi:hypothetical protein